VGRTAFLFGRHGSRHSQTSSFTVGLPRSGTNFFQSLLTSLTGRKAVSIYTETRAPNLKTHALSLDYLYREIDIFDCDVVPNPQLFVLLRDPRDAMISFYDFFVARGQGSVDQAKFLDIDFFLAFSRGTAKTDLRNTFLEPMSVEDAFRAFGQNWIPSGGSLGQVVSMLHYEDLLVPKSLNAALVSAKILPPTCTVEETESHLGHVRKRLVSQYSRDRSGYRGIGFGFKHPEILKGYQELIAATEDRLGDVIDMFGYRHNNV